MPEVPYLLHAAEYPDGRGMLRVLGTLPFNPVRMFDISDVPQGESRGGHAHRECWQVLYCAQGEVSIATTSLTPLDHEFDAAWHLQEGDAVVLPPLNCVDMTGFSSDCVLVVLASHPYNPSEVIAE